jgi:hypothetical protein
LAFVQDNRMQSNNKYLKEALRLSQHPLFIKANVVSPKGKPLAYLRYRVLRPLLKGYYKAFKLLHPGTPWTSPAAVLFFERVLNKDMTGFEYGSGLSTVFFARKLKHLVSVEHHEAWHRHVQSLFEKENIRNVDYHLIPPNTQAENPAPEGGGLASPVSPADPLQGAHPYTDYARFISKYPDAHFDFILIDGRARVACSIQAIPKLKPGGIFVLDNSEREKYAPVHQLLAAWPSVNTTTGLTDTTFWFKPEI